MKRYFVIGFLCLFSLHSIAKYYYYHGEKVNITINADRTLYLIQQEQTIQELRQKLEQLEK